MQPPSRFERAVRSAGWTARIGGRLERLAALALGVVADREIARQQVDFLPVVVDERCSRVDARLEPQQPRASRLAPLIDIARQDLLLDAGRIAFRRRPAVVQVEPMEFKWGLFIGMESSSRVQIVCSTDMLSAFPGGSPWWSPTPACCGARPAPGDRVEVQH